MAIQSRGEKAINERYRPLRLSELIGNEKNKKGLMAWMSKGSSRSKALLLAGASSGGKTTTARILAMGLNCEKGDTTEPCLECASCRAALAGTAFHIIEHNMAELNGKDDADEIVHTMSERCLTGRNKVYILDEVQMLTAQSQNLFLKTLESPPPGVYIILCTTDPDKLIKPLRTRLEPYYYSLPTERDISELLHEVTQQEHIEMSPEDKRTFFDRVQGLSYREILFALEQFSAGASISELKTSDGGFDDYEVIKQILYQGNIQPYLKALETDRNNIDYEGMRRRMRVMAGTEIERAATTNLRRAMLYCDVLEMIEERKFFEQNNRPNASALFWKICQVVKDYNSPKK